MAIGIKLRTTSVREPKTPRNKGYCLICEDETTFAELREWLRDHYICESCGSIPRNRALINALNIFEPKWKQLSLHESSPGGAVSEYLKRSCKKYSSSHYYDDVPRGTYRDGHRSEDVSQMSFKDKQFDVFVTSDVFEHVFEPEKSFSEISRVLKPGGKHIFTMPWYPKNKSSVQRAKLTSKGVKHLQKPMYHGNPIDVDGSLVTYDWGRDFCDIIYKSSGMPTMVYLEKNRDLGLEAEFLEVFISTKPA